MSVDYEQTLATLPKSYDGANPLSIVRDNIKDAPILVALDDDPTGTQTVNGIYVLTTWSVKALTNEFKQSAKGFFILTNSRALTSDKASILITEICTNLQEAAKLAGVRFEIVLRGDSTLRGHFPAEPLAVEKSLGRRDVWIVAPFFEQGGRLTINDVHYVKQGNEMVPAGETEFAKDSAFGYRSSNLQHWVDEKVKGFDLEYRTASLPLGVIRKGPQVVADYLNSLQATKRIILAVNAVETKDMDIVAAGLVLAEKQGKKTYLFRSAAAFVSSRLAIPQTPPLKPSQLDLSSPNGGLVVVGSYVPKSSAQLSSLLERRKDKIHHISIDVNDLLGSQREDVIRDTIKDASNKIGSGEDVVLATSRKLVTSQDAAESLRIGDAVSTALVQITKNISSRPRYVIAKGGITSSDTATKALNMKRALIQGQASAGIPIWRSDEEGTLWKSILYIVFPGNVGAVETLGELVESYQK